MLCCSLKATIAREDTRLRKAISVERRVGITLWFLATCSEYRTIAHLFGVGRSTVCEIVCETCEAIVSTLLPRYIQYPTGSQLQDVVDGFLRKFGLPQCGGAIDGSHIPIAPPTQNHTDYYNRKGWYSMIIQAVVDHNNLFRDINVGWPGSVHDARVFVNSSIYRKAINGDIFTGCQRRILGQNVPVFLVGDSAYPMHTWLMKPFAQSAPLSNEQKTFNYRLSHTRIVVENAFGRLKGRWRRLSKKNDMSITNIPNVIAACCILHNLCEIHGEAFCDSWMESIQSGDSQEEPAAPSHRGNVETLSAAQAIRNNLVHYMNFQ